MIRPIGIGLALALALGSLSGPERAAAAHHEPVIQTYTVRVEPGKLEAYRGEVKKLQGVLARIGSPATIRMWSTTAAGPDTGTVLVGVEYPNAAAWAADQPKIRADSEWQRVMSGLPAIRKIESSGIWRDISASAPTGGRGSVLLVTGVRVMPGKLEEYRKRVDGMRGISERLGLSGRVRMWEAELAGPATGNVAVGAEYPDLATYVTDQAKLSVDAEWQKLLSGLGEIRTLGGRWLYEEITP